MEFPDDLKYTREHEWLLLEGTVATVGKQLEEINPTAVPLTATIQRAEFGLPLIVNVDENIDLIPGEAVQLRIIKRATVN